MQAHERYILMLEDDSDDRYITQQTLDELGFDIPIRFVSKSNEVIAALERAPLPALILIDYNTKPENGLEVLKELKAHPVYNCIPVVLLSDSNRRQFIEDSYRSGASSYIQKPRNVSQTRKKIETFFRYWFEVAEA